MKSVTLRGAFGLENLSIISADVPHCDLGEVVIRLNFAALNYRDWLMVTGKYNPNIPLPFVPLSDGAGEIIAMGKDVSSLKVADVVTPIFALNWLSDNPPADIFKNTLGGPLNGTMCQVIKLPQECVVKIPRNITTREAASLPCAALTAYNALFTYAKLTKDKTVLIQGTGGVSMFALQFALLLEAKVIVLSSSDEKLEKIKQMGNIETINYRSHVDWHKEVRCLTNGVGVDVVVEVGGSGTLERSIKSVKNGGHISLIGILANEKSFPNLLPVIMRNISLQGILVGNKEQLEKMYQFIESKEFSPIIDSIFLLNDFRDAFEYLHSGKHFGKILIDCN